MAERKIAVTAERFLKKSGISFLTRLRVGKNGGIRDKAAHEHFYGISPPAKRKLKQALYLLLLLLLLLLFLPLSRFSFLFLSTCFRIFISWASFISFCFYLSLPLFICFVHFSRLSLSFNGSTVSLSFAFVHLCYLVFLSTLPYY